MARNRRNKRKNNIFFETITIKKFFLLVLILITIIAICITIISYRNSKNKEILAKQREELDRNIEAIFETTNQNIINFNNASRNSIIKILAVGDILCENDMLKDAKNGNTYNFEPMFKNVSSLLTNSDITLGTMETNYTNESYSGYGKRNSPLEFAEAVKDSGVNLVSISTNHSLDYGVEGIQTTKRNLERLGYSVVGDNLSESRVLIKEIKNTKIAFLSYTYGVENQTNKTEEELNATNIYNEVTVKSDLEYANKNADYNIVIMHWGEAYSTEPSNKQKEMAEFLIDNGANIILGNHASTVQTMEIVKNKEGENVLVAYSLGNYISAETMEISKVELVLSIEIKTDGKTGNTSLNKVEYTPIYVLDNGKKAENRYELIDLKGTAKAYANGNTQIINKKTYNKLLDGLNLLDKIIH